ncbi:hypothetical protein B5G28_08710 [Faecalibacterium sp. An77]|uniref:hypothetical protein n=1 Tax=Faecalibacterium sp. An77 TaxID=1965655 RepID=UPI000B39CCDC|nr:hypothetical protein [Faecalibacterium sp. An77]OUN38664.1 hypothetical protein B5G28_08710 [Faecalibacterium sp. An77]
MNTHSIELDGYYARSRGSSTIHLGTAGSHGNEQLQVTQGKGWEGLTIQVVFHPSKVAVHLPANGLLDVPWEATAQPLSMMQGRIVFQGFDQDRLVNSTDLAYTVASHSPALGRDEEPYTPGIVEGVLNQMAADKDAILQAAQQTGQAKEAAAASANQAAGSAANAQQSAGAANTSAGQASASASQAAGSAAAAGEALTQVQTAGQEAQQKVKDAETEALDKIAAAAPALPAVSSDAAWQSVTVKLDGTGYNLAALAPIEATIRPTVTGNPAVCENSAAWGLQGLKIYGKSVQNGTPSPESPVPIVSAGEGGSVELNVTGANLLDISGFSSGFANGVSVENQNGVLVYNGQMQEGINISVNIAGSYSNRNPLFTLLPGTYYVKDVRIVNMISGVGYQDAAFTLDSPFPVTWVTSKQFLESTVFANNLFYPMLNVGASALPWQPYVSQSLPLSTPSGLSGVPVTSGGNYVDSAGQQRICDVVDQNGVKKYTKKVIFDGSDDEKWMIQAVGDGSTNRAYIQISDLYYDTTNNSANFLCDRFKAEVISGGTEPDVAVVYSNRSNLFFYNNITGDIASWRNWLAQNPISVLYPTTEIVTTPLSDEEIAAYRALQTYSGTTVVSTAEPVAGLEVSYVIDGNKYRESIDKRLAALEAAQTGI